MNIIKKLSGIVAIITLLSTSALANGNSTAESQSVKKARIAVEAAPAYDWKTLAESAKICFEKNQNTEQALEWINKSIQLEKDPMNLEILADYYVSKGETAKGIEKLIEAIDAGRAQNFWYDSSNIQAKIWKLR